MNFPKRRSLDLLTIYRLCIYLLSSFIKGADPGYAGPSYLKYCTDLCQHFSTRYAIPCCSGTNAIYLAIKSLDLPLDSVIHVSSISDPGTYSSVIENSHAISLIDSESLSGQSSLSSLKGQLTDKSSAVILVHHAGYPSDISAFAKYCADNNLHLIQDLSQFHLSSDQSSSFTSFGAFCILSTMYRKSHSTGGAGGVLLTNDSDYASRARSLVDRGKIVDPSTTLIIDNRDGNSIAMPSINHCLDDLSCFMGICSLKKLDYVISSRSVFSKSISHFLNNNPSYFQQPPLSDFMSPFIVPITINPSYPNLKPIIDRLFAAANVPHNPNYLYLSNDWSWIQPFLVPQKTPNSSEYLLNTTFLYVNERYSIKHASYIVKLLSRALSDLTLPN